MHWQSWTFFFGQPTVGELAFLQVNAKKKKIKFKLIEIVM